MDLPTVKKLVSEGETDQIEFKRKVRHPEKIIRELVAFANTRGGHLFVGVDDDGSIPGAKFPEEEAFQMKKAIQELCRPTLKYDMHMVPLNEKRGIVHFYIPESPKKPHYAVETKDQRWGKAYVRVEDKSLQASRELRQIIKGKRNKVHPAFSYGENEKTLMNYLGDNEYITLDEFVSLTQLKRREASEVLIRLTLNNVLKILPREQGDWFVHVD